MHRLQHNTLYYYKHTHTHARTHSLSLSHTHTHTHKRAKNVSYRDSSCLILGTILIVIN
jgi:hypothetical protein